MPPLDPETGKIAADDSPLAIDPETGDFRGTAPVETPEQIASRVAQEEQAKGLAGSLSEGLSSAANQFALGVPEAVDEGSEDDATRQEREARQAYHSTARLVGGGAGLGASLALGAGLFDAAGEAAAHAIVPAERVAQASLAAKLTAKAANAATQGAMFASPAALTQAAFGDPQKAAETLLWGIGAGAVLGTGEGLLGEAAGAVGRGAKSSLESLLDAAGETGASPLAARLDKFANESAVKATGATRQDLNRLGVDRIGVLGATLHDEGLIKPGMTRQDIGDAISAAHADVGRQLGDALDRLDDTLTTGEIKEGHGAIEANVEGQAPTFASTATGRVREGVDGTPIADRFLRPGDIASAIKANLDSPELRMPMNSDQAAALDQVVRSAAMIPTTRVGDQEIVNFHDAQQFVSDLRQKWVRSIKLAQNEGGSRGVQAVTPLDQMKLAAYQFAKNTMHDAADRVAAASEQPALVGELARAKLRYAKLSDLEKFAATLDRHDAAQSFSDASRLLNANRGPFSAASQAVGAAFGALAGPGGAFVGSAVGHAAGLPLDFLARKWSEDKGMVLASTLAKRASKEGPDVFSAVLASEASKRLAATMTTVRDAIDDLAVRGAATVGRSGAHMGQLLGSTVGLTPDQAYQKLSGRLTTYASNPGAMATAAGQVSAPLQTSAPMVADAFAAKQAQAISYLYSALPKAPTPPGPFAPQQWAPTPKEKLDFHDKAEIVANPMRGIERMKEGTLSAAHVEALQTVYPAIYGMMRDEILRWSAEHPTAKLPSQERASVARFLGMPVEGSLRPDRMRSMQAVYGAQPPKQVSTAGGAPGPRGKLKDLPSHESDFGGDLGAGSAGAS